MINRVLIRIKVVQLLYSYLLNRSDFKITEPPVNPTKDASFAYSAYLELLTLVTELSAAISDGTIANGIRQSDRIKELTVEKAQKGLKPMFDGSVNQLLAKIEATPIFKDYKKNKQRDIRDEALLWRTLLLTTLMRDASLKECARKDPGFTLTGYERAFEMAAETIGEFSQTRSLVAESRKALSESFAKAYELYHRLLWLMVEITDLQESRLDNARHKYIPSAEDLNPDTRFIDNRFIGRLRENSQLAAFIQKEDSLWADSDDTMVRSLLDSILQSEYYTEYMALDNATYEDDCALWRKVFKNIILPSDQLAEALENESVYWNDDLMIMGEFVLKTIRRYAASPEGEIAIPGMFKDDTDQQIGPKLLAAAISHREEYTELIRRFTDKSWEMERMAMMDIVILVVAMAELLNFPEIPTAVTVNEYVEMAHCYSTPKSGQFINGMLSSVITHLRRENLLQKP